MTWGQAAKFALLATGAVMLTGAEAINDPGEPAREALRQGHYAEAEQLFRRAAFDADCKVRDANMALDAAYLREWTDASFIYPGPPTKRFTDDQAAAVKRAEARDALDEIVRRAATTRIVMLNENHHLPRSRAFAAELTRRLRPLGYDVLATETFSNNPDQAITARAMERMAAEHYPRQGDGFYSADPVYGSFVRAALALGYRPAAYETTNYVMSGTPDERANRREQDEAEHLAEILRRNPNSKILVYVGFDHLYETAMGPLRPMGLRLKELTGIDPLTIDQTRFLAASFAQTQDSFLSRLEAKAKGRSVILFDGNQPLILDDVPGGVDVEVVHPVLPVRAGRPGWLFTSGHKAVKAPAGLAPKDGDILLQAFGKDDASDAVPIDQVVWHKGAPPPTLALLPGAVRYWEESMPSIICPGVNVLETPGTG